MNNYTSLEKNNMKINICDSWKSSYELKGMGSKIKRGQAKK